MTIDFIKVRRFYMDDKTYTRFYKSLSSIQNAPKRLHHILLLSPTEPAKEVASRFPIIYAK